MSYLQGVSRLHIGCSVSTQSVAAVTLQMLNVLKTLQLLCSVIPTADLTSTDMILKLVFPNKHCNCTGNRKHINMVCTKLALTH